MAAEPSADSELIECIKRRDPDALAKAYDRYAGTAYSVLVRITRDRSAAEDLLQELFLRVWHRARHFDESKGGLGVWILAIARNMAIDYVRSAGTRFIARLRPLEAVDSVYLGRKSASQENAVTQRAIAAAVQNLNENERRVLELAYFEGMSQTEIAAKLEEPLGTVKSRIRSGLARLRTAMKAGAVS